MSVIVIGILLSIIQVGLNYILGVSALHTFINKDAINLIGIMLSINCASIASLHIKLVDQEEKIDEGEVFAKTKKKLNIMLYFLLLLFLLQSYLCL